MSATESSPQQLQREFTLERTHIIAAIIMTLILLVAVSYKPLAFCWALIFPVLLIWVVLRSATRVTTEGIDLQYPFSHNVSCRWGEIDGVKFAGSKTLLVLTDGTTHKMPGVSFNSLPALSQASHGRIPDPVTPGKQAAHDTVDIVARDGRYILRDKNSTTGSHKGSNQDSK